MKRSNLTNFVYALTISAGLLAANYATAQTAPADPTATPRIDQRQAKQQARINQGVASGSITPQEQARLQARQNRIATKKAAAKADGVVTQRERKQLTHQQNHASKGIARKKHNAKTQ